MPNRRWKRRAGGGAVGMVMVLTACVPAGPTEAAPTRFDEYTWSQEAANAPWGRRAGARAVVLGDSFFLLGGRTPNRPLPFPGGPVPGDSTIWGDVWRSDDQGRSWVSVLSTDDEAHWPARSYHAVVVHGSRMVLLGGQNFRRVANPACAQQLLCLPQNVSRSTFFNDVWASEDGANWELLTAAAPWSGRAGLSAAVLDGVIYVLAGSVNDDAAITLGPPNRLLFNDVWKSTDGIHWEQATAAAPWAPRAGAQVVVKDGYLYLLGGEYAFTGSPPPYFNDVWRSRDGAEWERVTESAGWSPRPGHSCDVLDDAFVCFGGYGQSPLPWDVFRRWSPTDMWVSDDGAEWHKVATVPWNAGSPDGIRYDFAALVAPARGDGSGASAEAIYTFGGDRENFNFFDPTQWRNVDADVWRFGPPVPLAPT